MSKVESLGVCKMTSLSGKNESLGSWTQLLWWRKLRRPCIMLFFKNLIHLFVSAWRWLNWRGRVSPVLRWVLKTSQTCLTKYFYLDDFILDICQKKIKRSQFLRQKTCNSRHLLICNRSAQMVWNGIKPIVSCFSHFTVYFKICRESLAIFTVRA